MRLVLVSPAITGLPDLTTQLILIFTELIVINAL